MRWMLFGALSLGVAGAFGACEHHTYYGRDYGYGYGHYRHERPYDHEAHERWEHQRHEQEEEHEHGRF